MVTGPAHQGSGERGRTERTAGLTQFSDVGQAITDAGAGVERNPEGSVCLGVLSSGVGGG